MAESKKWDEMTPEEQAEARRRVSEQVDKFIGDRETIAAAGLSVFTASYEALDNAYGIPARTRTAGQ